MKLRKKTNDLVDSKTLERRRLKIHIVSLRWVDLTIEAENSGAKLWIEIPTRLRNLPQKNS